MEEKTLTPKQERFIEEYPVDLNATQAAIRAGYSKKTAAQAGERLLRNVDISMAIEKAMEDRSRRTNVTVDYVITNLVEVVERCMQRAPVVDRKGEQIKDENGNNLWAFNDKGANKALELLGKHLGAFTERVDLTSSDGSMSSSREITIAFVDAPDAPGDTE